MMPDTPVTCTKRWKVQDFLEDGYENDIRYRDTMRNLLTFVKDALRLKRGDQARTVTPT